MAGATEYFNRLLSSDFKERDKSEINFSGIFSSVTPLRTIIDYLYGVEITLSEEYIEELLNASKMFLLEELAKECEIFLWKNLTLRNSLWVWALADTFQMEGLYNLCKHVVGCRFPDVIQYLDEAFDLPRDRLLLFLREGMAQHCSPEELDKFLQLWSSRGDGGEYLETKLSIHSDYKHFSKLVKAIHGDSCQILSVNQEAGNVQVRISEFVKPVETNFTADRKEIIGGEKPQTVASVNMSTYDSQTGSHTVNRSRTIDDKYEEVILCSNWQRSIVYRPRLNKWFNAPKELEDNIKADKSRLCVIRPKYSVDKGTTWQVMNTRFKYVMVSVFPLPRPFLETHFFCLKGKLFLGGILSTVRLVHPEEGLTEGLFLLVYVNTRGRWSSVCTSNEPLGEKVFDMSVVPLTTGDAYFFITYDGGTALFIFKPEYRSITILSKVTPNMHRQLFLGTLVSGHETSDSLIFCFKNRDLLYMTNEKIWKLQGSIRPHSTHVVTECFMKTSETEICSLRRDTDCNPCYFCLFAYKKGECEAYLIPSPPTSYDENKITSQIVKSQYLDELEEAAPDFDVDKAVLLRSQLLQNNILG